MTHSALGSTDLAERHRHAIQTLAEHSHSPLDLVEEIYRTELSQLETDARITQYLPLVTSRRARDRLRTLGRTRPEPRLTTPAR